MQTGLFQLQKRRTQLQTGRIQLESCRIHLQKPVIHVVRVSQHYWSAYAGSARTLHVK